MSSQPYFTVKGSWEDLLAQANEFAEIDSDECIPIWHKLVDRLSQLPNSRLDAGEGHLRSVRLMAANQFQQYLVYREQYDVALRVLQQLARVVDSAHEDQWQRRSVEVLILAGQPEEALAKAQENAKAAASDDIDSWGDLVYAAISLKEFKAADEALREIERRINRVRKEQGAAATKEDSAYLSWLRANSALAQELWDEAIAWWTHASTQDKHYAGEVHNLYIKLIRAGQLTKALSLIEQDQGNQIRSDFWRGLTLVRLGKEKEGQQYWRRIGSLDVAKDESFGYALTEYFLAHYYLPELRDSALTLNLQIIREGEELNWGLYYLCALGFALRNEIDSAHIHLSTALQRYRKAGLGKKLPWETWFPFGDLVEATVQPELKSYFVENYK
ncbi:MAG: hypothetical protein U0175_33900 [Caldilineaceae bacterium]